MGKHRRTQAEHSQSWRQLKPADPKVITDMVLKATSTILQVLFVGAGFFAAYGLLIMIE